MDGCVFFHFGLATVYTGKVAIRQGVREGTCGRIAATIHIVVRWLAGLLKAVDMNKSGKAGKTLSYAIRLSNKQVDMVQERREAH